MRSPTRVSVRLAEGLAFAVFRLLPKKLTRYEVARQNLKSAFGNRYSDAQIDDIIRRMWIHLFRLVIEIVQLPRKLRLYNCADVVEFRNRDESVKALSCGRPVIVLSGHFGNWEMAVSTFGVFGFPMGVVARDLDNPYLHQWFQRFREHTGHRLLSKKGGGGDMVEFLERSGNLALLGDQDAGKKGLFVPVLRAAGFDLQIDRLVGLGIPSRDCGGLCDSPLRMILRTTAGCGSSRAAKR